MVVENRSNILREIDGLRCVSCAKSEPQAEENRDAAGMNGLAMRPENWLEIHDLIDRPRTSPSRGCAKSVFPPVVIQGKLGFSNQRVKVKNGESGKGNRWSTVYWSGRPGQEPSDWNGTGWMESKALLGADGEFEVLQALGWIHKA